MHILPRTKPLPRQHRKVVDSVGAREIFAAAKSKSGNRSLRHPWQDSEGNGELVSWEVWAALSELVVCQSSAALVPPVSAASVWQRAEEIRRAETALTADPTVDGTSRTGFRGAQSDGDIGTRSAAGFVGFESGHGDISFWADEDGSRKQLATKECCKEVERTGNSRTSRKSAHQQTALGSPPVRGRPNSAPQARIASTGRLLQTLAKCQKSWSLRSRSQCQLRRGRGQGRGQGATRGSNRGLRRSSSSPSHRNAATCTAPTLPNQRHETPHSRRITGRERKGSIVTPTILRRPMTAPLDPAATRSDTEGFAHPTTSSRPVCAREGCRQVVQDHARMRGVAGGLESHLASSAGFVSQTFAGTWGGEEADTGLGGGSEFEWRGDEAARDDMENGHLRTETASAKRKAARYQTCMLEAQVHTACSEMARRSSVSVRTDVSRARRTVHMLRNTKRGGLAVAPPPRRFCGMVHVLVSTAKVFQRQYTNNPC